MTISNFRLSNGAYVYRPLKYGVEPGWDIVAVQSCLQAVGHSPGTVDGWFGTKTKSAVISFQTATGLTPDGIAGILTQRSLALRLTPIGSWPKGLDKGIYEFEGGFVLGNYSALYADGTRDFSVVQDNLSDQDRLRGFDTPACIKYYFDCLSSNYARYWDGGKNRYVTTQRRAWELAVGWWNRPAHTDRIARGQTLTAAQTQWIESYINRITTYVEW